MRLGITFNHVLTETPGPTTASLAMTAADRGHEVWAMGAADFEYSADDKIRAHARRAPAGSYKTPQDYHKALCGPRAQTEKITVDDLDLVLLRGDPSAEINRRPWAQTVAMDFARMAIRQGVIVLNDPGGLIKARDKSYFQLFPKQVRPRTLISRDREAIKRFVRDEGGQAVLKPLQGSGGQSVFLVKPDDAPNLNQMIDAVSRDGYVVAQEYLPAAAKGDMRLFLMNGSPFQYQGKIAAFRRVRTGGDMRSNISAGGKLRRAEVDDVAIKLAEAVRPKLVQDGMFLVGLDVVGDKLMEINVFSPGGLNSARMFEKVNFAEGVIDALERKVGYARSYGRNFNNVQLATL
ncbi:MAG: glutathione synthetase [Acidobacteria bacterium]|nr:glutathione synthetase [Acidobacteriota bacterium]MDA1234053.1 glutathione synthetase [Acidobacteriota bacterium]